MGSCCSICEKEGYNTSLILNPLDEHGSPNENGSLYLDNRLDNETSVFPVFNDVRSIFYPKNVVPVVCMGEKAVPLVFSPLFLPDMSPTTIRIPIISAGINDKRKMIGFSQKDVFKSEFFATIDTTRFFQECIKWLSSSDYRKALILSSEMAFFGLMRENLRTLGFYVDVNTPLSDEYSVVLITTDVVLSQDLFDRIKSFNGGIGILYSHQDIETYKGLDRFNTILWDFDLSFCKVIIPEVPDSINIVDIISSPRMNNEYNLAKMAEKLCRMLENKDIDMNDLDDLISILRYHVLSSGDIHLKTMQMLMNGCWDYLSKKSFKFSEADIRYAIIVLFFQEVIQKLPFEMVPDLPGIEEFPGIATSPDLINIEISIATEKDEWISTGVWLPSRTIGYVECIGDIPDITIQIGSHPGTLLNNKLPLKRWPSTVRSFQMNCNKIPIYSSFGGIVYVLSQKNASVSLIFSNVMSYSLVSIDKIPSSINMDVPWCELVSKSIIYTLPSNILALDKSLIAVLSLYDRCYEEIMNFLGTDSSKHIRIVFDVDTPIPPYFGYPIFEKISNCRRLFSSESQPSCELFSMMTSISINFIPEGVFDQITELAIGSSVALAVLSYVFPDVSINEIGINMDQPLLMGFFEICKMDRSLLKNAIASVKKNIASFSSPEVSLVYLLREIATQSQRNVIKLFDKWITFPEQVIVLFKNFQSL